MEECAKASKDALKALEVKVSTVSVKLPPFWPTKAVLWFVQAEAQFLLRSITADKTKFTHVMTMLDSSTAEYAMDLIRTPPDEEAYGALQARLTGAYAISEDERAERLQETGSLARKHNAVIDMEKRDSKNIL